jgi:8-oxo-dGTP pyrophosphatase MutT (NUDIX family)
MACVAAVALDARGRVLLIRHRTRGGAEVPGGKALPGEADDAAVAREVREETGLRVMRVGALLGVDRQPTYVARVYAADVDPGEPAPGDDATEAWWGEPREVAGGTMPQDYEFVLRALDRRRMETT